MKASARNQFIGKVTRVQEGTVNDAVELRTASGVVLIATITRATRNDLGIQEGASVTALVKASAVVLITDAEDMRFSARNQFTGLISSVQRGVVNSDVLLTLESGDELSAVVTNSSSDRLELEVGQKATALFKAASVILAVPA